MNASDILKYGHETVVHAVERIPVANCETSGVCGVWSVKDIMIHLASYEEFLVEILTMLTGKSIETPVLDRLLLDYKGFGDTEVAARQHLRWEEVWRIYVFNQATTMELIENIPLELRRKKGVIAWYGEDYDLEDFLVYTFYGHKREHSAQINIFGDNLLNK